MSRLNPVRPTMTNSRIHVKGCHKLSARGFEKLFYCCREITEFELSDDLHDSVPWDRIAELCDGVDTVILFAAGNGIGPAGL